MRAARSPAEDPFTPASGTGGTLSSAASDGSRGVSGDSQSPNFLPLPPVVHHASASGVHDASTDRETPVMGTDDIEEENLEGWLLRRTKEYNQRTREQPRSEELWLEFAEFQEEAVRAQHEGGRR